MYSLSCQFDELPEELGAFGESVSETHFRHHPELNLVEAAQEHVQVAHHLAEVVPPEHVVQELILSARHHHRRARGTGHGAR